MPRPNSSVEIIQDDADQERREQEFGFGYNTLWLDDDDADALLQGKGLWYECDSYAALIKLRAK